MYGSVRSAYSLCVGPPLEGRLLVPTGRLLVPAVMQQYPSETWLTQVSFDQLVYLVKEDLLVSVLSPWEHYRDGVGNIEILIGGMPVTWRIHANGRGDDGSQCIMPVADNWRTETIQTVGLDGFQRVPSSSSTGRADSHFLTEALCQREGQHPGPCNGVPRVTCLASSVRRVAPPMVPLRQGIDYQSPPSRRSFLVQDLPYLPIIDTGPGPHQVVYETHVGGLCQREDHHSGPCNGFPRVTCLNLHDPPHRESPEVVRVSVWDKLSGEE